MLRSESNLEHSIEKWNSSSTVPAGGGGPGDGVDGVDGVLVLGGEQYAHILRIISLCGNLY